MSHLFHRLHEQNYIAHVMAYAACIGPSAGKACRRPSFGNNVDDDEDLFSLPHSPLKKNTKGFFDNNLKSTTSVDSMAEAQLVASEAGIGRDSALSSKTKVTASAGKRGPSPTSSKVSASASATSGERHGSRGSSSSSKSKFPTLSPTLQQLLDSSQQRVSPAIHWFQNIIYISL